MQLGNAIPLRKKDIRRNTESCGAKLALYIKWGELMGEFSTETSHGGGGGGGGDGVGGWGAQIMKS